MTHQQEGTSSVCPDEAPCQEISDPAVLSKTPLVSVTMVTYNHEPYIAEAIEGVLIQETNFPIELVIGEDCSTDRTREIVFDYQRKYPDIIRVVTSENNVGAHDNSERTTKLCRGTYIAFCEGDDYWHHPKKLQMQVDYLESHPECGLVHSDVAWQNVVTGQIVPEHYKEKNLLHNHVNVVKSMILYEYHVMTCSAIVRRKMLNEVYRAAPYEFSGRFLMGDLQTWIEIAYRSEVKYMDVPLATYHQSQESACRSQDIEKIIRFRKSFQQICLHYADKYGGEDSMEMKKRMVSRSKNMFTRLALRARKPDLAKDILENSRKYDVPLGLVGYLCCYSRKQGLLPVFVRALLLLAGQSRLLLSRIKWLRVLRDRIRGLGIIAS